MQLTPEEHEVLQRTFQTTRDRHLRERCQAVLMASRGRKRQVIAQDVGMHRTTLRRWLKTYAERGVEG